MQLCTYTFPVGKLTLSTGCSGLSHISLIKGDSAQNEGHFGRNILLFRLAFRKLQRYFAGEVVNFNTLTLDLHGTEFQLAVWRQLAVIPHNTTIAYSELARRLNRTNAVRAVANALGANPLPIILPCHRVLRITGDLGGYIWGDKVKRSLLALEREGRWPG